MLRLVDPFIELKSKPIMMVAKGVEVGIYDSVGITFELVGKEGNSSKVFRSRFGFEY